MKIKNDTKEKEDMQWQAAKGKNVVAEGEGVPIQKKKK